MVEATTMVANDSAVKGFLAARPASVAPLLTKMAAQG
jgi:hypothetical protein